MSQHDVSTDVLVDILKEHVELFQRQIARLQSGSTSSFSSSSVAVVPPAAPAVAVSADASKKKKEKKVVDPNKPKRPASGYQLFMADNSSKCKEANPGITQTDLMSMVAKMWSTLNEDLKAKYLTRAEKLKDRHYQEMLRYTVNMGYRIQAARAAASGGAANSSSAPAAVPVVVAPASPKPKVPRK